MGVEFAGFGLDGRSIKGGVSLPAQRLGRVALIAISVELSPYGWPAALLPLCQVLQLNPQRVQLQPTAPPSAGLQRALLIPVQVYSLPSGAHEVSHQQLVDDGGIQLPLVVCVVL